MAGRHMHAPDSVEGHLVNTMAVLRYMVEHAGEEPWCRRAANPEAYRAWTATYLRKNLGVDITVRTLAEMAKLGYVAVHSRWAHNQGPTGYVITDLGRQIVTGEVIITNVVLTGTANEDRELSKQAWDLELEIVQGPSLSQATTPDKRAAWYKFRYRQLRMLVLRRLSNLQLQVEMGVGSPYTGYEGTTHDDFLGEGNVGVGVGVGAGEGVEVALDQNEELMEQQERD